MLNFKNCFFVTNFKQKWNKKVKENVFNTQYQSLENDKELTKELTRDTLSTKYKVFTSVMTISLFKSVILVV